MKIAMLWIVFEFGMIAVPIGEQYIPGLIEEAIAETTPEMLVVLAITTMIPPIMAFLSLTLKDSTNRWANIIVGIVFAGFVLIFSIGYVAEQSAYFAGLILIGIVQFVATALIVWYAWKSKQKA